VNLASPLHHGEEQPDTELFLRAVPFILHCWGWGGGEKIAGKGEREIGRFSKIGEMVFHILFMLL